jgi:DNA polymerase III subunit gamma/tau
MSSSATSSDDAGVGHDPRGVSRGRASSGPSGSAAPSAPGQQAPRSLQDNAGWGSPSGPAPDWATAPVGSPVAAAALDTAVPGSSRARGASAVRESFAAARSATARRAAGAGAGPTGSQPPEAARAVAATDDSAVSDDDEDIEQSGDVGRTVVEKVLGGRVLSETTD